MVEMKIFEVWGCQRRRCRRCLGVCPHGHAQPPIAGWVVATLVVFPPLQWWKPDDAVGGIEEAKGYRRTGENPTFKAVLGLACGAVTGSSFSELGISITEVREAGFQLASCANMRALMKFFGLSPKAIPRMDLQMPGLPGLHGIWAVAAFDTPVVWGGRLSWVVEPVSN